MLDPARSAHEKTVRGNPHSSNYAMWKPRQSTVASFDYPASITHAAEHTT